MALHTSHKNSDIHGSSSLDPCNIYSPFSLAGGPTGMLLVPPPHHEPLVLDSVKGELVKAPKSRAGKKVVSEEKALAALRNHSEAERRRRERINSHLATLRGLVPSTEKMDKATLLAHVIKQVKELKNKALEASKGLLIPLDADEVKVEPCNVDAAGNGTFSFKVSICCEYRSELLYDLRQAWVALNLKIIKAEVSTLESRIKSKFILTTRKEEFNYDFNAQRVLTSSIHQALSSILAKNSITTEYSPRTMLSGKRRRVSLFDSLSSSS